MMHTEDEAREKWCPFVRLHADDRPGPKDPQTYSYNRPGALGGMTCIGSACMAFRWGGRRVETCLIPMKSYEERKDAEAKGWRYEVSHDDGFSLFVRSLSNSPALGFCGLAGRPE